MSVAIAFAPGLEGCASAPEGRPVGEETALTASAAESEVVCTPANTIDVLFIGNSYVKYSDLSIDVPGTYRQLAEGAGKCVFVDSISNLGWTLNQHAASAATTNKINSRAWDVVVLQDNSNNYNSGSAFQTGAAALKAKIKANNACSRVMLYLIPAWNDPWNAATQTTFTNKTKSVQNALDESTCPAGEGWRKANQAGYSLTSLFDDSQHPSERGEYLIASAFYARIHKKSAVGLMTLPGVTATEAAKLQAYADAAVFSGGGTNFSEWEDGPAGGAFAPNWCSGTCPASETDACGRKIAKVISTDPAFCATQVPYSHPGFTAGTPLGNSWQWYSTGCGCGYRQTYIELCDPNTPKEK